MKAVTFLVAFLGYGALGAGCSASSEGDGDGGSDGGEETVVDWSKADPPDYLDITTCAHITDAADPEFEQCSACCLGAGYSGSSFLNDDKCTCSNGREDGRDTVCMTEAGSSGVGACETCCETAGFNGYSYASSGQTRSCECHGLSDTNVCADSLAGNAGSDACFFCCLNEGFLSAGYSNFGEEECLCMDP